MTDEELAKELERYADGLVGGPVLKGLPRTKDYPGDRENEEREATERGADHGATSCRSAVRTGRGRYTAVHL